MVVRVQNGSKCMAVYPCEGEANWELFSLLLPSTMREGIIPYTISLGKDANLKFAQEKIQIQSSNMVSTEWIWLSHHPKA